MKDINSIKFAAGYRAFYGIEYIFYSIHNIYNYVNRIVIAISNTPQVFSFLRRYKPAITDEFIKKYPDTERKIDIIRGNWGPIFSNSRIRECEAEHANCILNYIRQKCPECNYLLILDTDEILTDEGITAIKEAVIKNPEALAFKMRYRTYWKGLHYIAEQEECSATVCVKIAPSVKFTSIREINEKSVITLDKSIYYHHPSYALSSKNILLKLKTFGHAKEIRRNWYKDIWKAWDKNKNIPNLHPLFDGSWWKKVIRISNGEVPQILRNHPYFKYGTVDDFEKAWKGKKIPQELWIPNE